MKYRGLLLFSLVLSLGLWAEEPQPEERPPVPEVSLPFPVGEKLTYTIYWGWIEVGESVATTDWVWEEDTWRIRIRFRTKSNGVLSALYPVDDTVETLVDPVTLRPLVFHMNLREGKHQRNETTVFDWENLQAHYVKTHEDKPDETKSYEIAPDTRDLVSFMYFLRQTPFEADSTYEFEVMSDEKLYDLTLNTRGYQKINLEDLGKVRSLRMDPTAQFQGVFVRKGEMRIWLSDGERQLLTKMFLDTPFANVRLLLRSVEGPGAESWPEEQTEKK